MPKYLDSHMDIDVDECMLSKNKEIGYIFCMLDAPDEEAIKKRHEQFNIKCDNIWQVKEI